MLYECGNITIKTNNAKLGAELVRSVKPSKRANFEVLIDRHCDSIEGSIKQSEKPIKVILNTGFEVKLKTLKEVFRGRRFHRRDEEGLKLSEIEKQVLHHIDGIPFRKLNTFRASAWSQLAKHKIRGELANEQ